MTPEDRYEAYRRFAHDWADYAADKLIPHCDMRILHAPEECEFCANVPELQECRKTLGIAWTGHEPDGSQVPCEADTERPPGSDSDHRRWGGNKPTSAHGDASWPAETGASVAFPDFGLVRRAERAERERDRFVDVLRLGWTIGQYEWAKDRLRRFEEDYFTPNGLTKPSDGEM